MSLSRSAPRRILVVVPAATGLAVAALVPVAAQAASETPFVSEIHYDNAGTDTGEAIEITAAAGTDLTGWRVVLYNGNGGAAYDTRTLDGLVADTPADDPSGDATVVLAYPANGIQNGSPDGLALVEPGGRVVEFLSYEGPMTATGGPAAGATSTDIGVSEPGDTAVGDSLQRVDGVWAGPAANTFGQVNDTAGLGGGDGGDGGDGGEDPTLCETTDTTPIPQIQGGGAASPLSGQVVTTRGVVVADTQAGLDGFYLQETSGDGDPATSDGIFVYGPQLPDVQVGDVVTARGTVVEFFGLTELSEGTTAGICGTGDVPPPVALPFPSTDAEREPYEGMLVGPAEPLSVTGLFNVERFGEVRLSSGGILVEPTEAAAPGAPAAAVAAQNRAREIVLDDGSDTDLAAAGANPPYLTIDDSVRIADVAELGSYVLSYGFDNWRLQPATGLPDQVTFSGTNPRSQTPEDTGGDVTVAAFNVLNYFTTLTSESGLARGAATPAEFAQQEAKIVAAVNGLGADVVALQEIQYGVPFGEGADVALAALVDALNADLENQGEAPVWDYVPTPRYFSASPDVIQTAIIYTTDTVSRVGDSVSLGSDLAAWDNAREPVAQLFSTGAGDDILVVSNHFKSKSSGGAGGANADQGDGQGAYNADRTQQAQALADAVGAYAGQVGEDDVYLMGDFNAYGEEDPITTLEAAGFVDVVEGLDEYSYRFNWRNGNLDHALLSPAAADKLTGRTIWQVNAAEPFAYQYSGDEDLYAPYAYRASDHNPVIVGVDLAEPYATDVSLADVLAQDRGTDRNGADYDLLEQAVQRVLAARPDSAVAVLADPTAPVTAFLPNDQAFTEVLTGYLPRFLRSEALASIALRLASPAVLEQVLLYHVVPGDPLDSDDLAGLAGQSLTTAQGGTLTVDLEDDGTLTVADAAPALGDPMVVQADVNAGQAQTGHGIDGLLLPADVQPRNLLGYLLGRR